MNDHSANKPQHSSAGPPNLLPDHPESTDFFGAHTAIAKTLADMVLSENEGRCVAIEGAWGSGKSTVIDLLNKHLNGRADLFVFDTWSNQGDPLRYSFMTEFASWVMKNNIRGLTSDAQKWLTSINNTARQTSTEESSPVTPKSTEAQILIAALLVGLPVGLALASDIWSTLLSAVTAKFLYFFALFLVLAPVLCLGWLYWTKKFDLFKEILEALERAGDYAKRITVRHGPLATSLEFARQINEMCESLCQSDSERKLLVIFDNIDRVAESNSAKAWSFLSAFLDVVHDKAKHYANNIWVFVPVDLDSVPIPVTGTAHDKVNGLKRQFIEKTFQVTVVVPPPLSVAAERYFKTEYERAFSQTDAQRDWYECYTVLREMRGADESFTPRALKRFINDLVAIYRSRKELDAANIPTAPLMTFYLCKRHEIRHPKDLVRDSIPSNIAWRISDPNPIAVLASLAFGVKASSGLHLLVNERAQEVVETGDPTTFGDLISTDGFSEALCSYIESNSENWLKSNASSMARAYAAVSKLDIMLSRTIIHKLSGLTLRFVREAPTLGKADIAAARGLAYATVVSCLDKAKTQVVLQRMLSSVAETVGSELETAKVWKEAADAFLAVLANHSVPVDQITIDLPTNHDLALQLLQLRVAHLCERSGLLLRLDHDVSTTLAQGIDAQAASFSLTQASLDVVSSLRILMPSYDSRRACKAMLQRFQNTAMINVDSLGAAFALIDDTIRNTKDTSFTNEVLSWMQQGLFHHHYQVTQGPKVAVAGRLVGLMAGLDSNTSQIRAWNRSTQGVSQLQQFCNTIGRQDLQDVFSYLEGTGRLRDLIRTASQYNLNPFREFLLTRMLEVQPSVYTIKTYYNELLAISPQLSRELHADLTKYAVEQLAIDKYLQDLGPEDTKPSLAYIREVATILIEPERKLTFEKWIATTLEAYDTKWWKSRIGESDADLLGLVETINGELGAGWLSGEASAAITELIVSDTYVTEQEKRTYAKSFMMALAPEQRSFVVMQVVSKAIAAVGDEREFSRVMSLEEFIFGELEVQRDLTGLVANVLIPAVERNPASKGAVLAIINRWKLREHLNGVLKKRLDNLLEGS
nr:P-loop NTPase fold protein [Ferrimicrobium acidiphilum]